MGPGGIETSIYKRVNRWAKEEGKEEGREEREKVGRKTEAERKDKTKMLVMLS